MSIGTQRRKIIVASLMPAAIIGMPLALLLISQMRSLGRLEQATLQVLNQTGVRVAEEMAREVRRDFTSGHSAVLAAMSRVAVRNGDVAAMRPAIAHGEQAAPVGTFFLGATELSGATAKVVFEGASTKSDVGHATETSSAAWLENAWRAGFRPIAGLSEAVAARLAAIGGSGSQWVCGFLTVDEHDYLLIARSHASDAHSQERTVFAGYVVDAVDLGNRYFPALGAKLRGSEWAFSTDQPLEISIVDDGDREIFRTGPSLRGGFVHETPVPLLLLGDEHLIANPDLHDPVPHWRVRVGYPGTDAAALARSGTNQQRQVLLLVGLVATVGIVMSGRSVARELGLAGMKAEFVSSVSHDLKTPVASIQVLADVLKTAATMPPDKVKGYGKVIGNEARKLGKLIDGMLEFEKINTGGRMYIVEPIDLRAPVRAAIGEFATQIKEMGFRTEVHLPRDAVPFIGNGEALGHAFANVVGNAIKYSGNERYLGVELRVVDGNAVIDIHDRGLGIGAGERTKIFERFYRVRRDSETAPTGTGLGLPIALHVVRAHGGRMSVHGEHGGGSIFRIELPLEGSMSEPDPTAP